MKTEKAQTEPHFEMSVCIYGVDSDEAMRLFEQIVDLVHPTHLNSGAVGGWCGPDNCERRPAERQSLAQAWDDGFMFAAEQDHPAYPRTRRYANPHLPPGKDT